MYCCFTAISEIQWLPRATRKKGFKNTISSFDSQYGCKTMNWKHVGEKICDDRSILATLLTKGDTELKIFVALREHEAPEIRRMCGIPELQISFLKTVYRTKNLFLE